jgi:hypothetical protein
MSGSSSGSLIGVLITLPLPDEDALAAAEDASRDCGKGRTMSFWFFGAWAKLVAFLQVDQ